jgi:hypothetical protein
VAGLVGGLLYWGIAALFHRPLEYDEGETEEAPSGFRMITPDAPLMARAAAERVEEGDSFAEASYRRASFTFEPASPEGAPGADAPEEGAWSDNLKQTLSQTEIGRMFEGSTARDAGSATKPGNESDERPGHRDRLAG